MLRKGKQPLSCAQNPSWNPKSQIRVNVDFLNAFTDKKLVISSLFLHEYLLTAFFVTVIQIAKELFSKELVSHIRILLKGETLLINASIVM